MPIHTETSPLVDKYTIGCTRRKESEPNTIWNIGIVVSARVICPIARRIALIKPMLKGQVISYIFVQSTGLP